jgi:hypothetical protein
MKNLEIGAIYKHYKGNYYRVICIAKHSETLEDLVVYEKLYEDFTFWVRPKVMFLENIVVEGKEVERFQKISQ